MYDVDDEKMFVVDSAIQHKLGSKEEIELYEEMSLALELMDDQSFRVANSSINNGVAFGIVTKYPHGLPENVGTLFFNVSTNFDVKIKETSQCVYSGERYFHVNLKKST
jgi:hypothetical protein